MPSSIFRTVGWYSLYAVIYSIFYIIGRVLYFEPAPVSAMWPAAGFALGVLLIVAPRHWRALIPLQGILHFLLSTIDVNVWFALGAAFAAVVEVLVAVFLIRTWCQGNLRLNQPAHIASMIIGAVIAVIPSALIGATTVHLVYENNDFFMSVRIWLLSDLIGILVMTPALIAIREIRSLPVRVRMTERIAMLVMLCLFITLTAFFSQGAINPLLRPELLWIPLLWIGARTGPVLTALANALTAFCIVAAADSGFGYFAQLGLDEPALSLTVQVFVAVLSIGTLVIAASAHGRRLALEQVRATADRLSITLTSIGDGVIAIDKNDIVTLINPVACRLCGWSEAEAIGRPLSEVFCVERSSVKKPAKSDNETEQTVSSQGQKGERTELIHRSGERCKISHSIASMKDDQGLTVGAVIVFRDMTEHYTFEKHRRQTEKMEAIGRLSSGIAHDLNNMINGVLGGADLIRMRTEHDQRLMNSVDMIIKAGKRMRELTSRMLSYARRDNSTIMSVELDSVINDSIELMRHAIDRSIQIVVELNSAGIFVEIDRSQLHSALLNLAMNSRDAMPEGGILRVSTAVEKQGSDLVVAITVSDNGIGMTEQVLAKAFEPFYTTKPIGKGTGLGLHTVMNFVEAHDGKIKVNSELYKGTSITMWLPVKEKLLQASQQTGATKRTRLLVVDDDEIIRGVVSERLRLLGCDVLTAIDGEDGMRILNSESCDAVVLDAMMPKMDGITMLHELRKIKPNLPVVVASGHLPEGDLASLLSKGHTGFISKPYQFEDLRREFKRIGFELG